MKNRFHTALKPRDCNGVPMKPMDIVIVKSIPDHYWSDPEFSHLRDFSGCYGLITYQNDGVEFQPYYMGDKSHPGWVSGDASVVHVLTRTVRGAEVVSWDLWVPPANLLKIPFNSLVMNIFVEYSWQMQDEHGPGSVLFISEGLDEFAYIKKIMETPLSVLIEAHDAAMAVLDNSPR